MGTWEAKWDFERELLAGGHELAGDLRRAWEREREGGARAGPAPYPGSCPFDPDMR